MLNELTIVTHAVSLLGSLGTASAQYITAEFQPFSNQLKPDLKFIPRIGTKTGQSFFLEYRMLDRTPSKGTLNHLLEHREFVMQALELSFVHYGFALNQNLTEADTQYLARNSIRGIPNIKSGQDLYEHIFYWCRIPPTLISRRVSIKDSILTTHSFTRA